MMMATRRQPWLRTIGVLLLLVGSCSAQAQKKAGAKTNAGITVRDGSFHSVSLGRDARYRIILPRGYQAANRRFPVFYLLHGLYGDYLNWDTRTGLEQYIADYPWIVVMPDADNSWYTNSATVQADKYEDYIAKDLITEIDEKYRTIRSPNRRAIAGLSMGGYGAMKLALKYPDMFAFAGSLSGALDAPAGLGDRVPEFREKLVQVFGAANSSTRSENDIFLLLEKADVEKLPYLYLACGTDDGLLAVNRDYVARLSARKVRYEYHETPGGHSWDYWDRSLREMLESFRPILGK